MVNKIATAVKEVIGLQNALERQGTPPAARSNVLMHVVPDCWSLRAKWAKYVNGTDVRCL